MNEPVQKQRATRFDIQTIGIGPNQIRLIYAERGMHGSAPPFIDIHESQLPDDLIVRLRELLADLEKELAPHHDEWTVSPQALHDRMQKARNAAAQLEEATTRHAIVSADLNEKQNAAMQLAAHLDRMTAEKAKLEEEHAALDATLELKKAVATSKATDG